MTNYERDTAILSEEYRGDLLDLIHEGYVVVVDENGDVIKSAGNPEAMVYYRSASKPVQALPVIAHHLDEKYGITDEESVIFAGSHAGESFHVDAVKSIFKKADMNLDDLIMNPAYPANAEANEERIRKGMPKEKVYHNCSGKHTGAMLLQKELDPENIKDYWKVDSAAQKEILRTMAEISEYPEEKVMIGIDGCGVPVFAVPIKNIAVAFKNLACIDTIKDESLREAAKRYVPRIHEYPLMMRGTGFLCSLINYDPNIVAKGGANGVYGIGLKKERIGIAFKVKDGTEGIWPLIVKSVFEQIGYYNEETFAMLDRLNSGVIHNDNDTPVGTCKCVFELK
ncbi:MAG: asparaginase [Clostridia bacterium]|nr:asparaginase [Clostridia bacterium]